VSHRVRPLGLVAVGVIVLATIETVGTDAGSVSVAAVNFEFKPPSATVHVGDTVVWTMSGDGHTVTSGTIDANNVGHPSGGPLDSGFKGPGGSYSFTFRAPGTYPYFCEIHASSQMEGTITVVAAVATGRLTPGATPVATAERSPPPTPSSSRTVVVSPNPTSSETPPLATTATATMASLPGQPNSSSSPAASRPPAGDGAAPASDSTPFIAAGVLVAIAVLATTLARTRRSR